MMTENRKDNDRVLITERWVNVNGKPVMVDDGLSEYNKGYHQGRMDGVRSVYSQVKAEKEKKKWIPRKLPESFLYKYCGVPCYPPPEKTMWEYLKILFFKIKFYRLTKYWIKEI